MEGSGERNRGPTNRNRIRGEAEQGERASDREALVTKVRRRKSGGRAVKASVLTWGDLASRLKGRRGRKPRSEKSAEAVVAASKPAAASRRAERGRRARDERRESRRGQAPEVRRKSELPLEDRGEAPRVERSGEASTAANGNERSGSDRPDGAGGRTRRTCQAALKRVRQNKGSPGIDGMTVDELPRLPARALAAICASSCSRGRYQPQPVKRSEIPKPGGGDARAGHPDGARSVHPAGHLCRCCNR